MSSAGDSLLLPKSFGAGASYDVTQGRDEGHVTDSDDVIDVLDEKKINATVILSDLSHAEVNGELLNEDSDV